MQRVLWALPMLILLLATRVVVAHPKPGAHADVRINVERDGVRVEVLMNLRVIEVGADDDRVLRFRAAANWRVEGAVYHWGHSRSRTTEYAAEHAVASGPAGWRIVGCTPMSQRRIETEAQRSSEAAVSAEPEVPAWRQNR